jgi:hypothetical protein
LKREREADMYRRIAAPIAAVALVAAAALPASLNAQSESSDVTSNETRVTVQVDNGNWLDMRLYVVVDGGAYDRIGTVTGFSKGKFEIPRQLTATNSPIQLVAAPIGSTERYAAQPVMVSVGDVVEWRLANNLAMSSIFVRPS